VPQSVAQLTQVEFLAANLQIRRWENTDIQRLPTIDQDPLPEIKFLALHQQRPLNILLHYLLLSLLASLHNLILITGAEDAYAASIIRWLHDPHVMCAVDKVELPTKLLKFPDQDHQLNFEKGLFILKTFHSGPLLYQTCMVLN